MNSSRVLPVSGNGPSAIQSVGFVVGLLLLAFSTRPASAGTGVYSNGVGARSMALGGADVAWADDPISAIGENPAGLSSLNKIELDLGDVIARAVAGFSAKAPGRVHIIPVSRQSRFRKNAEAEADWR